MFKPGDKVLFYRDITGKSSYSQRNKFLGKVITLTSTTEDGIHWGGSKEKWNFKELDGWIVRDNEIRKLTKLELVLN